MKLNQTQGAFYILYKSFKEDKDRWVSPSEVDVGDVFIPELGDYIFTTWKTPARLSEMYAENPELLDRISCKSKAGSNYYKYRIARGASIDRIKNKKLLEFYKAIKNAKL